MNVSVFVPTSADGPNYARAGVVFERGKSHDLSVVDVELPADADEIKAVEAKLGAGKISRRQLKVMQADPAMTVRFEGDIAASASVTQALADESAWRAQVDALAGEVAKRDAEIVALNGRIGMLASECEALRSQSEQATAPKGRK